jgi:hypothetical protein
MRSLTHFERLEAGTNHIFFEVVSGSENPVMLHVANKAFYPAPPSVRTDPLATETERQGGAIDKGQSASIEGMKQEGYF